jgi:hypothetical protein
MRFIETHETPIGVSTFGGPRPFGFYAPGWAQFIAADHDGTVWAFQQCPVPDPYARAWSNGGDGGRYGLLGSCKQEIVNWQDAIFRRRGGLWVSAREEEQAAEEARFRQAARGSLWAVALLAMVVLVIVAVQASGTLA